MTAACPDGVRWYHLHDDGGPNDPELYSWHRSGHEASGIFPLLETSRLRAIVLAVVRLLRHDRQREWDTLGRWLDRVWVGRHDRRCCRRSDHLPPI